MSCDEKDRLLDECSSLLRELAVTESFYFAPAPPDGPSRQDLSERIDQLKRAAAKARDAFNRHVADHGCGFGPGARF